MDDLAEQAHQDILSNLKGIPQDVPEDLFSLSVDDPNGKRKRKITEVMALSKEQESPSKQKKNPQNTDEVTGEEIAVVKKQRKQQKKKPESEEQSKPKETNEKPSQKKTKRKLCEDASSLGEDVLMLQLSGMQQQFGSKTNLPTNTVRDPKSSKSDTGLKKTWDIVQGKIPGIHIWF